MTAEQTPTCDALTPPGFIHDTRAAAVTRLGILQRLGVVREIVEGGRVASRPWEHRRRGGRWTVAAVVAHGGVIAGSRGPSPDGRRGHRLRATGRLVSAGPGGSPHRSYRARARLDAHHLRSTHPEKRRRADAVVAQVVIRADASLSRVESFEPVNPFLCSTTVAVLPSIDCPPRPMTLCLQTPIAGN